MLDIITVSLLFFGIISFFLAMGYESITYGSLCLLFMSMAFIVSFVPSEDEEIRLTNAIELVSEVTGETEIELFKDEDDILFLKVKNKLYEVGLDTSNKVKYILLGSRFLYDTD